jgi:hypothetical protein
MIDPNVLGPMGTPKDLTVRPDSERLAVAVGHLIQLVAGTHKRRRAATKRKGQPRNKARAKMARESRRRNRR